MSKSKANTGAVGVLVTLNAGDVIIYPAGTAYSDVSDEGGCTYIAFSPDVGFLIAMKRRSANDW